MTFLCPCLMWREAEQTHKKCLLEDLFGAGTYKISSLFAIRLTQGNWFGMVWRDSFPVCVGEKNPVMVTYEIYFPKTETNRDKMRHTYICINFSKERDILQSFGLLLLSQVQFYSSKMWKWAGIESSNHFKPFASKYHFTQSIKESSRTKSLVPWFLDISP